MFFNNLVRRWRMWRFKRAMLRSRSRVAKMFKKDAEILDSLEDLPVEDNEG